MDLSLFKNKYPFSLKGLTKERNIYRKKKGDTYVELSTGNFVVLSNPEWVTPLK